VATAQTRPAGIETSRAIVEAALDLFAERAGVTQPLLNYHFAGKEELWRAAVDDVFDRVRTSAQSRLSGLRGVDEITITKLMVRHFVEFSASNPQLHRIIMQESKQPGPRLDWLVDTHVRPLYMNAVELFERLGGRGELAPVARAHLYYLLTGAGATVFVMAPECQRLTGVDPFTAEFVTAHADLVVDLLVRAATKGEL
jgi:TetR/AcrR family transcriptional regulator